MKWPDGVEDRSPLFRADRVELFAGQMPVHGWSDLLIMAVLACGLFLLAAYFLRSFRVEEQARLNRLLNRKIFIW
ncbi:MAG: hypothetical protein Q8K59_10490 [Nitrosomonas sp.]|nr:hypothetical protein [Nitrosomonas sp.]MDP1951499.1 hypothetical protein [Nitrosomonas sp.]